LVGALENAIY